MKKPITTIVTIPGMIAPEDWKDLEEKSEVQYVEAEKLNEDDLLDTIKDADYLMIDPDAIQGLEESFYKKVIERRLPLKAISADITGMSWAHPEAAKKYGIPLMNTADYSTISVAEFTVALLLVQVKGMNLVWNDRLHGEKDRVHKNDVLAGKTIGVVGLGNIGQKVCEMLQGFGVNIIAWDRNDKNLPNVKQLSLEEVIAQSDYLSIHLKTTEETKGMFDEDLLSHAKNGQYIINEADGPLVNNDALLKTIQDGKVSGYACANSAVAGTPLESNEKVMTFPPQAWFTEHSLHLLRKIWVENVLSAIDGKMQNLVD